MAADHRRRIVVNADDLGLHEDINRGIQEAHRCGMVTSASLVSCGQAFEDALDVLKACPNLDPGIHLTLIEEKPLCRAEQVSSLLDHHGRFYGSYRLFSKYLLQGKIRPEEIRLELESQIRRALEAGIHPSHLDSHQHIHLLPQVWQIFTELAHRYRIPFVRIPRFQRVWSRAKDSLECVSRIGLNVLSWTRRRQITTLRATDGTVGLHLSGKLKESDLLEMVHTVRHGLFELVVHPGVTTPALEARYRWGFDWSEELSALTSDRVRDAVALAGVCLVSYKDLTSTHTE